MLFQVVKNSVGPDHLASQNRIYPRDFPRPDLGPNISHFPIQKLAKTSQNVVYHSQFLSSPFWWKGQENQNKIAQLQMHENLHKNMNQVFIHIFSWVFMKGI